MRIETKFLEDREHYVVPTVMIVVGVHNGSQGPVLYTADVLRRSAPYWDGKPVVVYHPALYTTGLASHPEVFNRQKVGTLFGTKFDGARLTAAAWIDVERVGRVDQRVLNAIQSLEVMEVSTGLVMEADGEQGVHNGKNYGTVAKNIVPDHLAILPDQTGACCIADGAGLVRNETWEEVLLLPQLI